MMQKCCDCVDENDDKLPKKTVTNVKRKEYQSDNDETPVLGWFFCFLTGRPKFE